MGKTLARSVWLLALAGGALLAGEPWEGKPPAQWTQEEAQQVLTDSPWAREVALWQVTGRILGVLPDGSKVIYQTDRQSPPRIYSVRPTSIEPELVRAVYSVRWSTAETVQQALERLKEISPVLQQMQAPPPELSAHHYVLTARVVKPPSESALELHDRPFIQDESGRPVRDLPPTAADIFAGLSEEELRERAQLRPAGGPGLKPDRALRHGLGASEGVSLYFPRQQNGRPTLPAGTKRAEFIFEGPRGDKLKVKFNLTEMRVGGRPDY